MEGKHHQRKLHSFRPSGHKYIGAGCSNQMQFAPRHHLNADLALACATYTCIWLLHPAPILVSKMALTLLLVQTVCIKTGDSNGDDNLGVIVLYSRPP